MHDVLRADDDADLDLDVELKRWVDGMSPDEARQTIHQLLTVTVGFAYSERVDLDRWLELAGMDAAR